MKGDWFRLTTGNWLTHLGVGLILIIPLWLDANVLDGFDFGRYLWVLVFLSLITLGTLFVKNLTAQVWWSNSPIWKLTLVWLGVSWLAAIFGVNFYRSFWGTTSRADGLIFATALVVLIWLLLMLLKTRTHWIRLLSWMSWVGFISALYAVLARFDITLIFRLQSTTGERIGGLLGNPIFMGNFLLLTIFITAYFLYQSQGRTKFLYGLNLLIQLLGFLLASSRGPLIGMIAGVIVVFILIWQNRSHLKTHNITLISPNLIRGVVVGTGLVLAAGIAINWDIIHRLIAFGLNDYTVQSRLLAWKIGFTAILDRPFLGYGLENIMAAFNSYYQPIFGNLGLFETIFDRTHNVLVDQAIYNGIVGLVVMLALFGWVCILLMKKIRTSFKEGELNSALLYTALIATIVAYGAALMTSFSVVPTTVYSALLLAAIIFFTAEPVPNVSSPQPQTSYFKSLISIFAVALLLFDYKVVLPARTAAQFAVQAERTAGRRQFQAARFNYNQVQMHPSPYTYFLMGKYLRFATQYAVELSENKQVADADSLLSDGVVILQRVREHDPDNPTIMIGIPIFYALWADLNPDMHDTYMTKAREEFSALAALNPNREYMYLSWARVMIGIHEETEAKNALDKAASLTVPPRELPFWQAMWGIQFNKRTVAENVALLKASAEKEVTFTPEESSGIAFTVSYLVAAQEWQTALFYQQRLVDIDPENIDQLANLITIYRHLGDTNSAQRTANQIIEIDPTKKASVDALMIAPL